MHVAIRFLNLFVSLASVVAAAIAYFRPASLSGSKNVSPGEIFYLRMYAARAVPLGLVAGGLPFRYGGPTVACLLFAAAIVQMVDVWIGGRSRARGMMIGAAVGAIVHLLCGVAVL